MLLDPVLYGCPGYVVLGSDHVVTRILAQAWIIVKDDQRVLDYAVREHYSGPLPHA